MASNAFGSYIRVTTFGESHGEGIGCVLDGFPPGVALDETQLQIALARRSPGKLDVVSPRCEKDQGVFLSGVYKGFSTGAPITIWIKNKSFDSKPYIDMADVYRPGHAQFTYEKKYNSFADHRGGGRASARETAARVAAGYCASQWLACFNIRATAWLSKVGTEMLSRDWEEDVNTRKQVYASDCYLFCPDKEKQHAFYTLLQNVLNDGDSIGGVVTCRVEGLPIGIGEPVYDKIEARLAYAMLGLPASKGFEMGHGFEDASKRGHDFIDGFYKDPKSQNIRPHTNNAAGTLGGISTGDNLIFQVAFKPTSSIKKPIKSVHISTGTTALYQTSADGKHDPCVAVRAVPVVEAMSYIVVADLMMQGHSSSILHQYVQKENKDR